MSSARVEEGEDRTRKGLQYLKVDRVSSRSMLWVGTVTPTQLLLNFVLMLGTSHCKAHIVPTRGEIIDCRPGSKTVQVWGSWVAVNKEAVKDPVTSG